MWNHYDSWVRPTLTLNSGTTATNTQAKQRTLTRTTTGENKPATKTTIAGAVKRIVQWMNTTTTRVRERKRSEGEKERKKERKKENNNLNTGGRREGRSSSV